MDQRTGVVYIADEHAYNIRKVTPEGMVIIVVEEGRGKREENEKSREEGQGMRDKG